MSDSHDLEHGLHLEHIDPRHIAQSLQLPGVPGTETSDASREATFTAEPEAKQLLHRDVFGREPNEGVVQHNSTDEVYLDPRDGRLRILQVQTAPPCWSHTSRDSIGIGSTFRNWGIHSSSFSGARKAVSKIGFLSRSRVCKGPNIEDTIRSNEESEAPVDWKVVNLLAARRPILVCLVDILYERPTRAPLLYAPITILTTVCLLLLARVHIQEDAQTFYAPALNRHWKFPGIGGSDGHAVETSLSGIAKSSELHMENASSSTPRRPSRQQLIKRRAMPRFLCTLEKIDFSTLTPETDVTKDVWAGDPDEYVFVSYTRNQFRTNDENTRAAHAARVALLRIGVAAAQSAGVSAFWLDCFPQSHGNEDKEDVYRICDIVRSALCVVIAVNTPRFMNNADDELSWCRDLALRDWGKRLWTVPELLLAPSAHKIDVYDRGEASTVSYTKLKLGAKAWKDWTEASQLLDRYAGTVHLTPLELISIGNRFLRSRFTTKYRDGDYAYALMGLLRRRPQVVATDTDFMAFARISLSNSCDSILERLLCMQPVDRQSLNGREAQWHEMEDAYGAELHDIEPTCQIADIGTDRDSQIVVLDGIHGASICWSRIDFVPFIKRKTPIRRLTRLLLPKAPYAFGIGLFVLAISLLILKPLCKGESCLVFGEDSLAWTIYFTAVGTITGGSPALLCAAPLLLKNLYHGKFWSSQARLYGIQGKADLGAMERSLVGTKESSLEKDAALEDDDSPEADPQRQADTHVKKEGRLKWSAAGSLLSRPRVGGTYFQGSDPGDLRDEDDEGRHLFTIIDTYVLEATPFYAFRPPSVVLICGKEAGMQRAVLCSYDWRSQTFCREVVLRMKTIVLNRMSRVDQCRIAFSRAALKPSNEPEAAGPSGQ